MCASIRKRLQTRDVVIYTDFQSIAIVPCWSSSFYAAIHFIVEGFHKDFDAKLRCDYYSSLADLVIHNMAYEQQSEVNFWDQTCH